MNTTRLKGDDSEMLPEGAIFNNPARQCGVEAGRTDNGVAEARALKNRQSLRNYSSLISMLFSIKNARYSSSKPTILWFFLISYIIHYHLLISSII